MEIVPDLSRVSARVGDATGWRRHAVALLSGLTAAAALPPLYFLPLLWVAFPVFLWLLNGTRSVRAAAVDGWWFGFGFFLAGLHWISFSLLVDGDKFAWMIPFALILIPAVLALFAAAAAALSRLGPAGLPRLIALAAAWVVLEWARAYLFTGFPWNPIAVVWAIDAAPLQALSWFGGYGLGFLTLLAALAPAALGFSQTRARLIPPVLAIVFVAILWGAGAARLPAGPAPVVDDVRLRIVQPNIPQHLKWKRDLRERHLAALLRLSRHPPDARPTHVIWPETAVPFLVSRDEQMRRIIATAAPPGGLLLTGSLRATPAGQRPFRLWNSFHAIDPRGTIRATYDKYHLVPFGEYVPLRGLFGISKITEGRTDFTAGPPPRAIELPGLPPVVPQICYEIIFPGEAASAARPGWIVNITNDAWFGDSAGPRQHFALARMRAAELGLPVARAANTGISAMIDPWGRIVSRLDIGVRGNLDVGLPEALPPTIYSRIGEIPMVTLAFLVLAGLAFTGRRRG